MDFNFYAIISLFSSPIGALSSRLAVGATLGLLAIWMLARFPGSKQTRASHSILPGTIVLGTVQFVLAVVSLLFNQFLPEPQSAIGLLERVALTLTILTVAWIVIEDDRQPACSLIYLLLALAVVCLGTVSLFAVLIRPTASDLMTLWQWVSLLFITVSVIVMIIRKPSKWGAGLVVLGILAAGLIIHILLADALSGSMGVMNFAQLIGLPWLLLLAQRTRSPSALPSRPIEVKPTAHSPLNPEPQLVDWLLRIGLAEDRHDQLNAIAKAMSLAMVADICLIVEQPRQLNEVLVLSGFDLIREVDIPAQTVPIPDLIHIQDAWKDGQRLILTPADADLQDIRSLALMLKCHRLGHVVAQPLIAQNRLVTSGLIFLSPYTGKQWHTQQLQLLDQVSPSLAELLFSPKPGKISVPSALDHQSLAEQLKTLSESLSAALRDKDAQIAQLSAELQPGGRAAYRKEGDPADGAPDRSHEEDQQPTSPTDMEQQASEREALLLAEKQACLRIRKALELALERATARIAQLEGRPEPPARVQAPSEHPVLNLEGIASDLQKHFRHQLEDHALTLAIDHSQADQSIRTDDALLMAVLRGLLENAIAASPKNATIALSLQLLPETGMLVAEVTDYGVGLTTAEQAALFNAEQASFPGIGSMQSIHQVIRAIRLLHGKIWLRSEKDQSTTFRVQLPIRVID